MRAHGRGQPASQVPLDALRSALAEQALGTEHEDQDQDREDDRLGPVTPGRVPPEPVVERLDESDHEPAEDRSGEVADPAQPSRGDGAQADAAHVRDADARDVNEVYPDR